MSNVSEIIVIHLIVNYWINQLLTQRVYSIILGYEDINDNDNLGYDSALAIALQKLDNTGDIENILAGKSTLNRWEYIPQTITEKSQSLF